MANVASRNPAVTVLRQVELPGDAETVIEPAEAAAEAVLADRHERGPALGKGRENALEFLLRVAVDEKGKGRRESEGMLHGAVDAHDGLARNREVRLHDRSLDPGF